MIQQSMLHYLIKLAHVNSLEINVANSLKCIKLKIKEMLIFKIGMIIGLRIHHHI